MVNGQFFALTISKSKGNQYKSMNRPNPKLFLMWAEENMSKSDKIIE